MRLDDYPIMERTAVHTVIEAARDMEAILSERLDDPAELTDPDAASSRELTERFSRMLDDAQRAGIEPETAARAALDRLRAGGARGLFNRHGLPVPELAGALGYAVAGLHSLRERERETLLDIIFLGETSTPAPSRSAAPRF